MAQTTVRRSAPTLEGLSGLVRLARSALEHAAGALLDDPADADADADAEARARAAAQDLATLRTTLEEGTASAPPGGALLGRELRRVVLAAHVVAEVEGIADVSVQLAELAWLRQSRTPLPALLRTPLRELAAAALARAAEAAEALVAPAAPVAAAPRAPDLDALSRGGHPLYDRLLAAEQPVDAGDAADAVLLSCLLVRAAHHAESVLVQASPLTGQNT